MVQKSQTTTWDGAKTLCMIIGYLPYQLVHSCQAREAEAEPRVKKPRRNERDGNVPKEAAWMMSIGCNGKTYPLVMGQMRIEKAVV